MADQDYSYQISTEREMENQQQKDLNEFFKFMVHFFPVMMLKMPTFKVKHSQKEFASSL
ncbi:hypothetical protein ACNF42_03140 [Cuniculiplasma sp. SKW3]|uniref:hypothetical protein n=1 Tax=Cuniculiplasma sp. SKW3 TaxID=3400170 RepID=UPI003FD576CC